MPYKLHPSYPRSHLSSTAVAAYDEDYTPRCCSLTYDHHTSCSACHEPGGLLRFLRAVFGGPRERCRHHKYTSRASPGAKPGSRWRGGVKGWARRKGCKDPSHRALAFRPWVEVSALPPHLDGRRTRLPTKCRQKTHSRASSFSSGSSHGGGSGGDGPYRPRGRRGRRGRGRGRRHGGRHHDGGPRHHADDPLVAQPVEYVQPFVEDAGPSSSSLSSSGGGGGGGSSSSSTSSRRRGSRGGSRRSRRRGRVPAGNEIIVVDDNEL